MFITTRTGMMVPKGSGVVAAPVVSDVFATSLYTGNNSTQTITNGIDLAGKGGMVWIKSRSSNYGHRLTSSENYSFLSYLDSTSANPQGWFGGSPVFSVTSSGFTLNGNYDQINVNAVTFVAFTFRKAARFFNAQMKSHTTGSSSTVDLSALGTVGMVFVKRTESVGDWYCWHRGLTGGYNILVNGTAAQFNTNAYLSVSGAILTIASGMPTGTYAVYGFAHDPDVGGIIQCGSYTGNGSTTGPSVNLGLEPQYIMIKVAGGNGNWILYDNARDTTNPRTYTLKANTPDPEVTTGNDVDFLSTGFQLKSTSADINADNVNYIYMAIKKAG